MKVYELFLRYVYPCLGERQDISFNLRAKIIDFLFTDADIKFSDLEEGLALAFRTPVEVLRKISLEKHLPWYNEDLVREYFLRVHNMQANTLPGCRGYVGIVEKILEQEGTLIYQVAYEGNLPKAPRRVIGLLTKDEVKEGDKIAIHKSFAIERLNDETYLSYRQ